MKILYLSFNPGLRGPFPKIDPLLISGMEKLDCQITKLTWGRHSENETLAQKIFGRLQDLIRAVQTLLRERYDILYVVTTLDEPALARDVPLLLATYWFSAKKTLILHGSKTDYFTGQGHFLYKFFARLLPLLSDAILLLSSEEVETWRKFEPRGRYYRVDNPFISAKPDEWIGSKQKENTSPVLFFAGRLIKAKGIFDLLHAMPIILGQVECRLLIAGDGEEREEIKRFIEKENLSRYVSLLGYMDSDQLSSIYRSSSVFILPTYFGEGFPTVIAEAMSFGLPLITTSIRGARDHLQDGLHALFVQPRDPGAIAAAVARLLNDSDLCLKMSRANLEKVREFLPENVVPEYVQIFHQLMSKDLER